MVRKRDLHIDQIMEVIAAQNAARIEEAFDAMLNEDQVGGLTAGNAMILLDALVERSKSNSGSMPRRTCETLGIVHGSTYANGVTAVVRTAGYGRIILRRGSKRDRLRVQVKS